MEWENEYNKENVYHKCNIYNFSLLDDELFEIYNYSKWI
jgi:hypothetical protein